MFLMNYAPNNGSPVWYPGQASQRLYKLLLSYNNNNNNNNNNSNRNSIYLS